jgi:hypothetical protein
MYPKNLRIRFIFQPPHFLISFIHKRTPATFVPSNATKRFSRRNIGSPARIIFGMTVSASRLSVHLSSIGSPPDQSVCPAAALTEAANWAFWSIGS